jgi:hypothetical protein
VLLKILLRDTGAGVLLNVLEQYNAVIAAKSSEKSSVKYYANSVLGGVFNL